MGATYLKVPYKERETAKALGARWDPDAKQWYVPPGRDVSPFADWLANPSPSTEVASTAGPQAVAPSNNKGAIGLAQLLAGVTAAVERAYRSGVWTIVDVVQASTVRGHVYLEVAERDANGVVLAKARAMIWGRVAQQILPQFERATGMTVGPGIKLLVRARPGFSAQHGFALEIDAVDPEYSLGDLEARKREIRARLKADGIFDANRRLQAPWDFNSVLVIAPLQAAGLGDFKAEAERLQAARVCSFEYVSSRFQGDGATHEIVVAAEAALNARRQEAKPMPDVVVFIRGGGAVNDLAWLNDYALARFICQLKVPVFTGIGHERDSTVLDEVAHTAFDTPSKVIAGIENTIRARTVEAAAAFEAIVSGGSRVLSASRRDADRQHAEVQREAIRSLAATRQRVDRSLMNVRTSAQHGVRAADFRTGATLAEVRFGAQAVLRDAQRSTPILLDTVRAAARGAVSDARAASEAAHQGVHERARELCKGAGIQLRATVETVAMKAREAVCQAGANAQALMREVAGQGPDKTLARGFALVRAENGTAVTSAGAAESVDTLTLQFKDGVVRATPERKSST
jgi:exodeoxyribonuclease VII large subunit